MSSATRFLRSFKLSYIIANIFQGRKLRHNKILYKKYGLTKSIYSSISSKDFEGKSGETPWLDRSSDGASLEGNPIFEAFAPEMKEQVRQWSKNGYIIYKHFINQDTVTNINEEIDRNLFSKRSISQSILRRCEPVSSSKRTLCFLSDSSSCVLVLSCFVSSRLGAFTSGFGILFPKSHSSGGWTRLHEINLCHAHVKNNAP